MQTAVLSREEKGRMIVEKSNQIVRIDEFHFRVASQNSDKMYDVTHRGNGAWVCNCFDHYYRQVRCKHIIACQISEQLREKVRENVIIQPVEITACVYYHKNLRRFGIRYTSAEKSRDSYVPLPANLQRESRL